MRVFKTRTGEKIDMQCFPIEEDIVKSRLFDTVFIQASLNNEVVGFIKLAYISDAKSKKLKEPFDYFIYKIYGSSENIVEAYEKNDTLYLLSKLSFNDLKKTPEELQSYSQEKLEVLYSQFKEKINTVYEPQFRSMVEYWVNKPNIELVRVFSDKDSSYTDYSQTGHPLVDRKTLNNYQGKGIGAALYEKTALWCQEQNMELWSSHTRTEEEKRLWTIMEKLPKFCIIMAHVFKYTNSGQVLQIERPKLRVA